jgi:hypothetical protein
MMNLTLTNGYPYPYPSDVRCKATCREDQESDPEARVSSGGQMSVEISAA